MTRIASIKANQTHLCVEGDVTLANVMAVYESSLPLIHQGQCFAFDFSGVHSSDSAGVALMIAWMRLAASQGKVASFDHIPEKLMAIAKAASLDTLISSTV